MAHLKRQGTPKRWPIPRKGTKYLVRPHSNLERGIPILVLLRDMLKVAQNRKEVKRALHEKKILLNSKVAKDDRNSAMLFDTISLVPSKKHYMLELAENGRFKLTEINEKQASYKTAKVVDKKTLRKKKVQLNLWDGKNYLSDLDCNVNDSVLVNLKDRKVEKCLPLKEKSKVVVFRGKHSGKKGIIRKLKPERKMASVTVDKDDINVLIKQIMAVE